MPPPFNQCSITLCSPSLVLPSAPLSGSGYEHMADADDPLQPSFHGISRVNRPTALFGACDLAAYSCKLVPFDSPDRGKERRLHAHGSVASVAFSKLQEELQNKARRSSTATYSQQQPMDRKRQPIHIMEGITHRDRVASGDDAAVDAALTVLADVELQDLQLLIDPMPIDGVIFTHREHNATQMHFSVPDVMLATLGPARYARMMKVFTGTFAWQAWPIMGQGPCVYFTASPAAQTVLKPFLSQAASWPCSFCLLMFAHLTCAARRQRGGGTELLRGRHDQHRQRRQLEHALRPAHELRPQSGRPALVPADGGVAGAAAGADVCTGRALFITPLAQIFSCGNRVDMMTFLLALSQAALMNDPAWWCDLQPGTRPPEPCLQACFTKCSLGLVIMRNHGDMFLAFQSQRLHVSMAVRACVPLCRRAVRVGTWSLCCRVRYPRYCRVQRVTAGDRYLCKPADCGPSGAQPPRASHGRRRR